MADSTDDLDSWFEQFPCLVVPPERIARDRWFAKLAAMVADAVEAAADGTIGYGDRDAFIDAMKLSRQDIAGIRRHLEQAAAHAVLRRDDTIEYLRALKVERVWTGPLDEGRLPRPGFTIEVLQEDGTVEVIEP